MTTAAMLKTAEQRCASQGERFTRQRRQVFRLLLDAERPLTAYQLLDLLKTELPGAQPPTVYRALDFLQRTGLIHRIDANSSFVPCSLACGEHLHEQPPQLLVCENCGTTREIPLSDSLYQALTTQARTEGFVLGDRPLALAGLCRQCQK